MTQDQIITIVAQAFAVGGSTYFGLKGALNGIKDRTIRIEARVEAIDQRTLLIEHDLAQGVPCRGAEQQTAR